MSLSRWKLLVFVMILALAVIGFPASAQSVLPNEPKAVTWLDAVFKERLRKIAAAYAAGNIAVHAQHTASLLALTNKTSIRFMLPEIDRLTHAVSKDGHERTVEKIRC